ncbi:UNVERIFIED_CONTAM: hypothetical protein FKN15_050483 [Acipenser sinensis]
MPLNVGKQMSDINAELASNQSKPSREDRTAGSTGASEKGAAGYKEGWRGQETSSPYGSAAGRPPEGAAGHEEGGGQETSFPSRTFAAGDHVVGAPRRGAAVHEEEGGGQETSSPSGTFAAGYGVAEAPEEGAVSHQEVGGGGHSTMATPKNTLLLPLPGL